MRDLAHVVEKFSIHLILTDDFVFAWIHLPRSQFEIQLFQVFQKNIFALALMMIEKNEDAEEED